MQRMNMSVSILAVVGLAGVASATDLQITIENTQQSGGLSLTPFWVALHNGGFDTYNGGQPAAGFPGITELAEDGLTGPISDAFLASPAGLAGGVDATFAGTNMGVPVFSPGESQTFTLNAGNTMVNRFFTYASMVVPTNDLFIGNGNPFAHEIFDVNGNFNGPVEILVFGRDINDNGTEVNDIFAGAAFSANGGDGIDEPVGTPVTNIFVLDPNGDYFHSIVGTQTADGGTITRYITPDTLIARITIVPAPGSMGLLALGGLVAARRRRG